MPDDLIIKAAGATLSGWLTASFTRGIESFPSQFSVEATQKDTSGKTTYVKAFDPVEVFLGADKVLTGYVDRVSHSYTASSHSISITGRSKCSDLVDCSAEFLNNSGVKGVPQLTQRNKSVDGLAVELCIPYGIEVSLQSKRTPVTIPNIAVNVGETPYEVIERFARSQNLLVYDDTAGNLVLADIGTEDMASGFELGVNLEAIHYEVNYDHRYSEIDVFDQTVISQGQMGTNTEYGKELDPSIRHRRLMLFSETPFIAQVIWTQQRATWEMNRRIGRSKVITLVTDSWRDGKGRLWQPNNYATIKAPQMGLDEHWIISEVTYSKNLQSGTTAQLTLMSAQAFAIEPTNLFPSNAALVEHGAATDPQPDAKPSDGKPAFNQPTQDT